MRRFAELMSCCARPTAGRMYFSADWVEPGMHISTIQHAELDPAVFKKADF